MLKPRCIDASMVDESAVVNIHPCYFTLSLFLIKRFLKLWDATNLEINEYINKTKVILIKYNIY